MNLDNLCMGCMTDKGAAGVCYNCEREEVLTSATLHHLPPRTLLEDRYLVGKGIYEDALGITYIVLDFRSKQRLTIKEFLPRHLTLRQPGLHTVMASSLEFHQHFDTALEKFDTESRRLVALPPLPGMHKTLGRFRLNNTAYRIHTYVEGINLQRFIQKNGGQISFKLLGKILRPVFEALTMAHRAGMLHGNISPRQIVVNSRSQGALVNFSMSLPSITPFVKNMRNIVEEGFAATEVYRDNRSIGTWTDVYSLAAVIYRAITGRTPPPPATREKKGELPLPSKLGKSIPPEAEAALMQALSLRAADRIPVIDKFGSIVIESADSVERDKLEVAQDAFTSVLCTNCSANNEVLIQDLKLGSFPCFRCGQALGPTPPPDTTSGEPPSPPPIEEKPVVPPRFQLPRLGELQSSGPGKSLSFPYPEPLETVVCPHCEHANEVEPRALELGIKCSECHQALDSDVDVAVLPGNNGFTEKEAVEEALPTEEIDESEAPAVDVEDPSEDAPDIAPEKKKTSFDSQKTDVAAGLAAALEDGPEDVSEDATIYRPAKDVPAEEGETADDSLPEMDEDAIANAAETDVEALEAVDQISPGDSATPDQAAEPVQEEAAMTPDIDQAVDEEATLFVEEESPEVEEQQATSDSEPEDTHFTEPELPASEPEPDVATVEPLTEEPDGEQEVTHFTEPELPASEPEPDVATVEPLTEEPDGEQEVTHFTEPELPASEPEPATAEPLTGEPDGEQEATLLVEPELPDSPIDESVVPSSFFDEVLPPGQDGQVSTRSEPETEPQSEEKPRVDDRVKVSDIRPTIDAASLHTPALDEPIVRKEAVKPLPPARPEDIDEIPDDVAPQAEPTEGEKPVPNPFRLRDEVPPVSSPEATAVAPVEEQPGTARGLKKRDLVTTVECSNCSAPNELTSQQILAGAACKECQHPFLTPRQKVNPAAAGQQGMIIEAGTPYRSPVPKIIFVTTLILVTIASAAFYWYLKVEERERNYNYYLQQGNKKYYQDDFLGAIDDYQISLEYKPDDEYAAQLIGRSKSAIDEIRERNSEMEALAAFQKLLNEADSVFTAKVLPEAKERYQLALEKSPYDTNSYIVARLGEIDLLLANATRRRPIPVRSTVPKVYAATTENLLTRLASAQPGTIIELTAGLFVLKEPITISKTVHLRGQGPSKTLIICSSENNAISVTNNATFHTEGISFEFQGDKTGNLLHAERATLTIENCRFTGARFNKEEKRGGSGVFFGANARGVIKDSYFANNYIGVSITQNAKPRISNTIILKNEFGLLVSDQARPSISFNQIKENNATGIYVTGTAQPLIENNKVTLNKVNGLAFYNTNFSGHVRKNEILNNEEIGIFLARKSRPTIEDNTIKQNGKGGILFRDDAKGIARRNRVEDNRDEGINIADNAAPSIEDNQISTNRGDGIEVVGNALPIIDGNRINNNNGDGISVQVSKSGGLIQNNSASGNRGYGISLLSVKRPNLLNNRTAGNYEGNIYDEENQ